MTSYSVFISFKNTYEGKPTVDSEVAEKLYAKLTSLGISTFYSNDTIKSLGASDYTQAIEDALDSATILILIGSRLEFIKKETSSWVYHEWYTYHRAGIHSKKQRIIVPYLSGSISSDDTPLALRDIQTYTLEQNSVDDVVEFVQNFLTAKQHKEEYPNDAKQDAKDKSYKQLKKAKLSAWVNIAIMSFIVIALGITYLVSVAMKSTFWVTSASSLIFLSIVACYPSVCAQIHYGRKIKFMPKAVTAVAIVLLCIPLVGVILFILYIEQDWASITFVLLSTIPPAIAFALSIVYAALMVRKIPVNLKH